MGAQQLVIGDHPPTGQSLVTPHCSEPCFAVQVFRLVQLALEGPRMLKAIHFGSQLAPASPVCARKDRHSAAGERGKSDNASATAAVCVVFNLNSDQHRVSREEIPPPDVH